MLGCHNFIHWHFVTWRRVEIHKYDASRWTPNSAAFFHTIVNHEVSNYLGWAQKKQARDEKLNLFSWFARGQRIFAPAWSAVAKETQPGEPGQAIWARLSLDPHHPGCGWLQLIPTMRTWMRMIKMMMMSRTRREMTAQCVWQEHCGRSIRESIWRLYAMGTCSNY